MEKKRKLTPRFWALEAGRREVLLRSLFGEVLMGKVCLVGLFRNAFWRRCCENSNPKVPGLLSQAPPTHLGI